MSDYPSSPAFSGPTPDVATGVPRLEAWLKADKQGIGRGLQSLTIASGSITPADGVTGSIRVDTESAAASDDLANIAQTNIPDGHYVMLQITDNARAVVVKHNAGGTGDIELAGGLDFTLNRVEQRLLLQRSGTTWVEVMRSGREAVKTSSTIAFAANWQNGAIAMSYWKDEGGTVHFAGTIENTAGVAANTTAANIVTGIDVGYRPGATRWFTLIGAGASLATSPIIWLGIDASGNMTISVIGQALAAGGDVYLDPISYRAEA